jgi:hypothetical protein
MYLKECKNRITCPLITAKLLGGLAYPIADVVSVVILANRDVKYFCFVTPLFQYQLLNYLKLT